MKRGRSFFFFFSFFMHHILIFIDSSLTRNCRQKNLQHSNVFIILKFSRRTLEYPRETFATKGTRRKIFSLGNVLGFASLEYPRICVSQKEIQGRIPFAGITPSLRPRRTNKVIFAAQQCVSNPRARVPNAGSLLGKLGGGCKAASVISSRASRSAIQSGTLEDDEEADGERPEGGEGREGGDQFVA